MVLNSSGKPLQIVLVGRIVSRRRIAREIFCRVSKRQLREVYRTRLGTAINSAHRACAVVQAGDLIQGSDPHQ